MTDRPKKGEPGYKEWLSEVRRKAAKKLYQDNPELREKRSEQMKARYEDPEELEKTRQQQIKHWSDPEEREKQRQRQLDFMEENPEITELRTQASRKYWSDGNARKLKSEQIEELWQDEEFREIQHQARIGNTNARGNRGKPKSKEHKRKIGDAHRGKKLSLEHIEKIRQSKSGNTREFLICKACKGEFSREEITSNDRFCDVCITHTKLCDCNCGEEMFKYKRNGTARKYINRSHASLHLWQDDKHREAMTGKIGQLPGEHHWNWQDGASFEPYDDGFTYEFREGIRTRQNRICADTDKTCIHPEDVRLDVHHIDSDKKNSVPENCIALCRSHHSRANLDSTTQTRHRQHVAELIQSEADD